MRLDHVALATRDAGPALAVLVGELGGTVLSGGLAIGYRPMQVHLGDAESGMKVELLEPWRADEHDFLDRFLTRHGEGPHHLTFKVADLEATLADVESQGFTPVGVDLSFPIWKEAFLQPREAHGTVVQLAESSTPEKSPLEEYARVVEHGGARLMGDEQDLSEQWWPDPPPRAAQTTYLRRIVVTTPSLAEARAFFAGLLQGAVEHEDDQRIDLVWPGGGRIRLEHHPDQAPGIHHLEAEGPGAPREVTVANTQLVLASFTALHG
jgi:catechol 2,3-dioxygenase-like lactoylglutathione lyase family enzyme